MSLDIELSNGMEMNWLRNPFGLERWARSNVDDTKRTRVFSVKVEKDDETRETHYNLDVEVEWNLWDVCNRFCYSGEKLLNEGPETTRKMFRRLFKEVVYSYWEIIKDLEVGYFVFDLPSYRQFVEGKGFPRIIDGVKYDDQHRMMIPMDIFHKHDGGKWGCKTLDDYKKWFKELVDFADALQDLENEFYGSN